MATKIRHVFITNNDAGKPSINLNYLLDDLVEKMKEHLRYESCVRDNGIKGQRMKKVRITISVENVRE